MYEQYTEDEIKALCGASYSSSLFLDCFRDFLNRGMAMLIESVIRYGRSYTCGFVCHRRICRFHGGLKMFLLELIIAGAVLYMCAKGFGKALEMFG